MKRVVIIRYNILVSALLISFGLFIAFTAAGDDQARQDSALSVNQGESTEELYQDIIVIILLPKIGEAVENYYLERTGYSPAVDPWSATIVSAKRSEAYGRLFEVTVEVSPYLGAHNSIGEDRITFDISAGRVEVLEYKHLKNYPIPPWLQNQSKALETAWRETGYQ